MVETQTSIEYVCIGNVLQPQLESNDFNCVLSCCGYEGILLTLKQYCTELKITFEK